MLSFLKTNSDNADFRDLVSLLDEHLSVINGEKHEFFAQYNSIANIPNVVVVYDEISSDATSSKPIAIGCGAWKKYSDNSAEIKRMFVKEEYRGQGIAKKILCELEEWSASEGFWVCVLETSKALKSAVNLYGKCGYEIIPNYGQYVGVEASVCMKKRICP